MHSYFQNDLLVALVYYTPLFHSKFRNVVECGKAPGVVTPEADSPMAKTLSQRLMRLRRRTPTLFPKIRRRDIFVPDRILKTSHVSLLHSD